MQAFEYHTGRAALLLTDNIDTDQILPARFLKKPRSAGYENFLFYDLRRNAAGELLDDFPLHAAGKPPSVLIAGHNFGCGSSREGAVYALADSGFRVVIATAIADIFRNNAISNGLLPIELDAAAMRKLIARCDATKAPEITVDLEQQSITVDDDATLRFTVDESTRRKLLLGRDEISETIALLETIETAEDQYHQQYPWSVRSRA